MSRDKNHVIQKSGQVKKMLNFLSLGLIGPWTEFKSVFRRRFTARLSRNKINMANLMHIFDIVRTVEYAAYYMHRFRKFLNGLGTMVSG